MFYPKQTRTSEYRTERVSDGASRNSPDLVRDVTRPIALDWLRSVTDCSQWIDKQIISSSYHRYHNHNGSQILYCLTAPIRTISFLSVSTSQHGRLPSNENSHPHKGTESSNSHDLEKTASSMEVDHGAETDLHRICSQWLDSLVRYRHIS